MHGIGRPHRPDERRAQAEGMPIIQRIEIRRMLASERQAQMCARTGRDETAAADPQMCARTGRDETAAADPQMCARTGRDETAAADPQMCAEGEAQMCAPPGGEQTFREALQIARSLLGRRASSPTECVELMALTYLASRPD